MLGLSSLDFLVLDVILLTSQCDYVNETILLVLFLKFCVSRVFERPFCTGNQESWVQVLAVLASSLSRFAFSSTDFEIQVKL